MNIVQDILREVRVEFLDEFNANFQRKAFFDQKWPSSNSPNKRGSMMIRTGALRRGLKARITGDQITFFSDVPYASIHNTGGEVKVTSAMKKYFWARYYQAGGGQNKAKTPEGRKRNNILSQEAQYWKNMALMPVGKSIKIPKRQFIGYHPSMDARIEVIADKHFNQLSEYIHQTLKR